MKKPVPLMVVICLVVVAITPTFMSIITINALRQENLVLRDQIHQVMNDWREVAGSVLASRGMLPNKDTGNLFPQDLLKLEQQGTNTK